MVKKKKEQETSSSAAENRIAPELPYPASHLNLQQMNRVLRHRLRNLCAGVKMTVDRIADTTSSTHPQISSRCQIIKAELDNLQEFTERLDLLFDKLPSCEPMNLFNLVSGLRDLFVAKFPFCSFNIDGPELNTVFTHGGLLKKALGELLLNAGDSAGSAANVSLTWQIESDGSFTFTVSNSCESGIPSDIPVNPPEPFNTLRSRHDGIGMAIAYRICKELKSALIINSTPGESVSARVTLPQEEFIDEQV